VNDVFGAVGIGDDVPRAYAVVKSSGGAVFSYASVVDNRSQDPICVLGAELPE